MDCLVRRKQEWRIGDVNAAIVGPRDKWRQYAWGNAERKSLFTEESASLREPALTPLVKEGVRVKTSKGKLLEVEREAKFVNVRACECCRVGLAFQSSRMC